MVAAIGALRFMGLLAPEPNPFDDLYARLEARLKVQLRATFAGATAATMRSIADVVGHAERPARSSAST